MSGAWIAFHSRCQVISINGDLSARTASTSLAETGVREGGLSDVPSGCSGIHRALSCALVEHPCLTRAEVTPKLVDLRALPSLRGQAPTPASAWSMPWRNLGMCHPLPQKHHLLGMSRGVVATPGRSHTAAWRLQVFGACHRLGAGTEGSRLVAKALLKLAFLWSKKSL